MAVVTLAIGIFFFLIAARLLQDSVVVDDAALDAAVGFLPQQNREPLRAIPEVAVR